MSQDPDDAQRGLTPAQRRVLGPAKSRQGWSEERSEPAPKVEPVAPVESANPVEPDPIAPPPRREKEKSAPRPANPSGRLTNRWELQRVVLGALLLIFLFAAFYIGKKLDTWRYQFRTRNKPALAGGIDQKFANVSAEDLIDQAIVEERLGNWQMAAQRFLAAKHKNLKSRGLLFRSAKLYYDHGNFDTADSLFDRAIAFGENVDIANYYRAMIANGRRDYAAGARFFTAASNAAPFNADYIYSLAETLRRSHQLQDAIKRYRQAALRGTETEETICRFKVRMTMLEAGDVAPVAADLEKQKRAGTLAVDWMLTDAALQLKAGRIEESVRLVEQARLSDESLYRGRFAACVGDKFFVEAANSYPAMAEVCRVQISAPASNQP